MTKSTITRERLEELAAAQSGFNLRIATHEESQELACMALAAIDSKPFAYIIQDKYERERGVEGHLSRSHVSKYVSQEDINEHEITCTPLYRHAQPAPVVPDDVLAALQKVARIRLDMDGFDGDRRGIADCLCDAEEALIEVVNRRAAMLQAAPVCTCPSGDGSLRWPCPVHPGNSPETPDGWTGNDKANAALMMLDRIETADPVDDDRIDGIKRIVRELAAAPHDTPALNSVQSVDSVADRWIPVSERMPEDDDFVYIWPRPDFGVELHVGQYCERSHKGGGWYAQVYEQNYGIEWHPITVTHWMPLPAVPQEVR
ncbi:DUF551 domain-containing protein [Klebsiella quasipneumoniae]|uniref:DUF551 domain-containing protein n=2 Tax=Klebsiella pneumoniae complex TaxID=3390273 RepID=UPI001D10EB0C|nr:DUF551 domain-containing protein [Klebsiella quasipneumoniae]